MEIKLAPLIKDNTVKFSHAIASVLYYTITDKTDGSVYQFNVDMNDKEDVGTATFNAEDKAMYLMRYMNKSIKKGEFIKIK